jgi:hypothetical protein
MNGRRSPQVPTFPQIIAVAFTILILVGIAIVFMDTWNKSITPSLSEEGQKQTHEAQDRFWFGVSLVGIAGIIVVAGVVLRTFGYI